MSKTGKQARRANRWQSKAASQERAGRRLEQSGLVIGAAVFIILAGLVHLAIAPQHWGHAPHHGLFFALAGVAEVAWGVAFARRPTAGLHHAGVVLAVWLTVLWLITRLLPAPFGGGPEAVEVFGVICRLSEGLGVAALVALAVSLADSRPMKMTVWRNFALLVAVAVLAGWLSYGVSLAAGPLLPVPMETVEHSHDH